VQLWRLFWVGPAALAGGAAYATWYFLNAGYAILAAAKMLGIATWVVGALAGDSLGWERRGLRLCQTLPLTPGQILAAKARWAALMGFAAIVVPFAAVCVLAEAEPFAEVLRGSLVLTFLVFVAAHAGVAVGALLRDLSGQGQPGMGTMMGAMLWLGLCVAMVAQVFFTSGYAVYGGLFFDLLLVAALWQRACLRLRWQHEPDELATAETAFSDSVVVFLMTYLLVTLIVLKAQAYGAPPGALESLRTYLLSALFPVVLAALSWLHLRRLPAPKTGCSWRGDLAWAAALAALTIGASLAYSYGMTRLGWLERDDLSSSVRTMRQMVAGLPMAPVLMTLLVGFLAPAAEEAFFRGLFYRGVRLLQPHDYRVAVLLSALAFGLLHPAAHFPVVFAMGLLLAMLVEWRGSLRPAILAHGLHNLAMWTFFSVGGGS
jgi:membrane protease YdiL (CAAX protease family)